jgi:hypothetical protein
VISGSKSIKNIWFDSKEKKHAILLCIVIRQKHIPKVNFALERYFNKKNKQKRKKSLEQFFKVIFHLGWFDME